MPGQSRFDAHLLAGAHDGPYLSEPAEVTGCDQLEFDPTIEARPTTNLADAPTGLEFDLHIPQNEDPTAWRPRTCATRW